MGVGSGADVARGTTAAAAAERASAVRCLRDELKLGAAADPVAGVLVDLRNLVDDLEPDQVPGRHAVDLMRLLDRIERVAASAKAQAMRRIAETDLWRKAGARTPAEWLARETGVKLSEAIRALETAQVSATQPETAEAVRSGQVSGREAHAVAKASKADPEAGRKLLEDVKAKRVNVTETEREAARIVTAASEETDEARAARHHASRSLRTGVDDDGMGWGHWRLPLAEHTRLLAGVAHGQSAAFRTARSDGRREPTDAYAADGLLALLRPPSAPSDGPDTDDGTAGVDDQTGGDAEETAGDDGELEQPNRRTRRGPGRSGPWGGAKVIFRVDDTAWYRGHTEPGEICEIAGLGPVPVSAVVDAIEGGALAAAVLTHGVDIQKVVHLGRHPTALQRTALEWTTAGTCAIRGCTNTARVEIDHVAPWVDTLRTEVGQLAAVCGHHHDLKTHKGYRFGPTGSDGKRELIPPPEPGGGRGDDPPKDGDPSEPEPPPALFDSG